MLVLLIGIVCFAVALWVRPGRVPGRGALAWMAVVAALALTQLWLGRERVDRYRLSLLGFRYRVADAAGAPAGRTLTVGGGYDDADLYVPGAGEEPAALLSARPGDAGVSVHAEVAEDPAAVLLVRGSGADRGEGWRVLGSLPFEEGDTLVVGAGTDARAWVVDDVADRLPVLDGSVPVPWVRVPRIRSAGGDLSVVLPSVDRGLLARLRPWHPSVFQRTYPLADVLAAAGDDAPRGSLSSFFFFHEGALRLAALDAGVSVHGREPAALPVWSHQEGGARVLVAGLPHRDYPEPDLTLPERYGVRPLRSFGLSVEEGWLDVSLASPEVRALDREALEELRLPGEGRGGDAPLYRVRLAPGRETTTRRAFVFDLPGGTFAVAGQAILRLPEDPGEGEVGILTPSGLARWETGRPFTLGAGDRGLLVRVDGMHVGLLFWLAHLAAFAMAGAVFLRRPMTGAVFALALTATGFAAVRLLLGVPALLDPPHVQEGQQIALWLLPLLPWAIAVAGEVANPDDDGGLLFHGVYALLLVGWAAVLFDGSPAKQAILGVVAVALLAARALRRPLALRFLRARGRLRRLSHRRPRLATGWAMGAALLAARVLLEAAGWREQVTLGGTRVGVSVLFTPLALLALAAVLRRRGRDVIEARGTAEYARTTAVALLDVGALLALGFLGVSAWISDFGIALVLLPGALLLLALLAARWTSDDRPGRVAAAGLAAPLLLFLLLQTAPTLLRFTWGGELQAVDARMGEWNRNELLLLERGDPDALRMIGQRRSEALAVMRETMRSYTRGNWGGKGFLQGRVSDGVAETATREHLPSALLASQWGFWGTAGLVLLLLSFLPPVTTRLRAGPVGAEARDGPREGGGAVVGFLATLAGATLVARVLPHPWDALLFGLLALGALVVLVGPALGVGAAWWGPAEAPGVEAERPSGSTLVAAAALFTLACAGLYMVAANYGLVFFTGKNVYLLGLDSVGDALEALALLGAAAAALALGTPPEPVEARPVAAGGPVEAAEVEAVWWHPSDGEGG